MLTPQLFSWKNCYQGMLAENIVMPDVLGMFV
jgi:hypothetical protein